MSSPEQWCLIESDPGVFTELIRGFGASGVQVEELYSLDPECQSRFDSLRKVHGLIFLFKWVQDDFSDGTLLKDQAVLSEIFFAKQVITNACATQALISILLNCHHADLTLGSTLSDFKEFTRSFDSAMKGLSLSNAELIRNVHNSFARPQVLEMDPKIHKKEKEDVYHFISYIPFAGRLLELDGLKEGPYDLGSIPEGQDWVSVARPHIEKRMQKYSTGEIHFNLMAVVSDLKTTYNQRIKELEAKGNELSDLDREDIVELKKLIDQEDDKMETYRIENIRRKFNYLPFIIEVLKALGKQGKLVEIYEKARENAIKAQEKKKVKA